MKEEFLIEYVKLCLKYNLEIRGCGDCGSAWLQELDKETLNNKQLVYEGNFECIRFADNYEMVDKNLIKLNINL